MECNFTTRFLMDTFEKQGEISKGNKTFRFVVDFIGTKITLTLKL